MTLHHSFNGFAVRKTCEKKWGKWRNTTIINKIMMMGEKERSWLWWSSSCEKEEWKEMVVSVDDDREGYRPVIDDIFHRIRGGGYPSAEQSNVTRSPTIADWSDGSIFHFGGTDSQRRIKRGKVIQAWIKRRADKNSNTNGSQMCRKSFAAWIFSEEKEIEKRRGGWGKDTWEIPYLTDFHATQSLRTFCIFSPDHHHPSTDSFLVSLRHFLMIRTDLYSSKRIPPFHFQLWFCPRLSLILLFVISCFVVSDVRAY